MSALPIRIVRSNEGQADAVVNREPRPIRRPSEEPSPRVAWGAIFCAWAIALGSQVLLALLGWATGIARVEPFEGNRFIPSQGILSGFFFFVSLGLSFFVGGFVAAKLAGKRRLFDTAIHGLTTWSLILVTTISIAVIGILQIPGWTLPDRIVPQARQERANAASVGARLAPAALALSRQLEIPRVKPKGSSMKPGLTCGAKTRSPANKPVRTPRFPVPAPGSASSPSSWERSRRWLDPWQP